MPRFVWVDGAVLPAGEPQITVFDRGFQLGDGIFETLRVRAARPTELPEHIARLRRSAAGLDIPLGVIVPFPLAVIGLLVVTMIRSRRARAGVGT